MKKQQRKCEKCYGYGWWPLGDLVPIGEMDSGEYGNQVIKCPWCGNGFNEGERFLMLKKYKESLK